ncbi:hypothetical protein ACVMAJ_001435 [Bradyrhizobium sp. USDA 4448]
MILDLPALAIATCGVRLESTRITRHAAPDSFRPADLPPSLATCLGPEDEMIHDGEKIRWYYL